MKRSKNCRWKVGAVACAGSRHVAEGTPCQDAVLAAGGAPGRRLVIACDGRGSSPHSQHGSAAAVGAFRAQCRLLEPRLRECLDRPNLSPGQRAARWRQVGEFLLLGLIHAQENAAQTRGLAASECEFTVAAAVMGRAATGVLQLGDSCIAVVRGESAELAFPPMGGECANETLFVGRDAVRDSEALYRVHLNEGISGIVAFTDGLAQKWLHLPANVPAGAVAQIVSMLGRGEWGAGHLAAYLGHRFWDESTDDDRGVAYVVRREPGSAAPTRAAATRSAANPAATAAG